MTARILPLALSLCLLGSAAQANPFTLAKGTSQLTFAGTFGSADRYMDNDGNEVDLGYDLDQTAFLVHFEHGLRDDLTLFAVLPWASAEREVVGGDDGTLATNDGVSDARLGLKWRLTDGPTAFALLVTAKWPGEYEPDLINSPGDGNFDLELLLSVGRQFRKLTLSADAGYRARSGNPDDDLVLRGELSYLFGPRFLLFAVVDWVDSQGGKVVPEAIVPFLPYSQTEEDFTHLSVGALTSFSDRVSAFLAWRSALDGINTALVDEIGLGLSFSF